MLMQLVRTWKLEHVDPHWMFNHIHDGDGWVLRASQINRRLLL